MHPASIVAIPVNAAIAFTLPPFPMMQSLRDFALHKVGVKFARDMAGNRFLKVERGCKGRPDR